MSDDLLLKLPVIKNIEHKIQSNANYEAIIDIDKPKFFATFPFPYVNGSLHLGHIFTLCKADFQARFKKLQGFNILYPFGFHGTGMPIVACANRLKYELENNAKDKWKDLHQASVLLKMNVSESDLEKFTDPYYWLQYFPLQVEKDVKAIGACIDFKRSFVTTDMNPYFDSFVTWQFNILKAKNLLVFGKKYTIYSALDKQPCADHDRSTGEGVIPKEYPIWAYEYKHPSFSHMIYLLTTVCVPKFQVDTVYKIYYNTQLVYSCFKYQDKYYVASDSAIKNLSFQLDNIELISNVDLTFLNNTAKYDMSTGIYIKEDIFHSPDMTAEYKSNVDFKYFEPETKVISRTGHKCIVALTDQWFINYGDQILKDKVNAFLDSDIMKCEPQILKQLKTASNWLKEWPVSRNFGLGTKLPGTDYVIDSLSDSTIYMAYYTIAHLITKISITKIKNDSTIWNYIFLGSALSEIYDDDKEVLDNMRKEFLYWYPVDVRVSGKDLISNHLIMTIYNHMAIWDDVKMCPKSYNINGYLMINAEKMSKGAGNFMTAKTAIDTYGCDPVRLALVADNGIDDGNFDVKAAQINIQKLYSELIWFTETIDALSVKKYNDETKMDFWSQVFDNSIFNCFNNAIKEFDQNNFRKAVNDGFTKMLNIRDTYRHLCNRNIIIPSSNLLYKFIECILLTIHPICPHWVENIWNYAITKNIKFKQSLFVLVSNYTHNEQTKLEYYDKLLSDLINKINSVVVDRLKKKPVNIIKITVINNFTDTKLDIINIYKKYTGDQNWIEFVNYHKKNITDKKLITEFAQFITYINDKSSKYNGWIDIISDTKTEKEFYDMWLPKLIDKYVIQIVNIDYNAKTYKYGPGNPIIEIL
jgi:leucyl-tRNA synthetase